MNGDELLRRRYRPLTFPCWQTLIYLAAGLGIFYLFPPRKHCPQAHPAPALGDMAFHLLSAEDKQFSLYVALWLQRSTPLQFEDTPSLPKQIHGAGPRAALPRFRIWGFTCPFRIQVMASRFRRYILRLMWLIRATALNTGLTYLGWPSGAGSHYHCLCEP
jgi:hypothetical protein